MVRFRSTDCTVKEWDLRDGYTAEATDISGELTIIYVVAMNLKLPDDPAWDPCCLFSDV